MSTGIIERLRDLRTISDTQRTNAITSSIRGLDPARLSDLYVGTNRTGNVVLMDSHDDPKGVYEMVIDVARGDSVCALYHAHPIFNSRGDYAKTREELIELLEDFADAGPQGTALKCSVRNVPVHIRSLGLMQLFDTLQIVVRQASK